MPASEVVETTLRTGKTSAPTYLVRRVFCPACKSNGDGHPTLYARGFGEHPVRDYLDAFYSSQGRIEFEYLRGGEFVLKECTRCGLVYQEYIPDTVLMNKLYEEWIDADIAFEARVLRSPVGEQLGSALEIATVLDYLETIPSRTRALDFGMGWGMWCEMAGAFGCRVYGTELSTARIAYARGRGVRVLTWEELREQTFDLINADQVFEHLSDPLDTLVYLAGSLSAAGLVKISVPNGGDIKRRLRVLNWSAPKGHPDSLNAVSPLEHINCFTHDALIGMASTAGLEHVRIPLRLRYAYSVGWTPIRPMIVNLVKPLYTRAFRKETRLFFRRPRA